MSLYIGNLSARTRREELERVFQRFGQCEVRLKDGYGFVVYGFAPQAEKAMKVLQGRNICGQQLTITWSNKQPRPFRRNGRGGRSYEPRGRDFGSRNVPGDYRDFRSRIRQPDGDGGQLDSEDVIDKGREYREEAMVDNDFVEDELHGFRDDLPREVDDVVPEIVDNGRWGERVHKISNDDVVDDEMMFDRYEPYHGHDRKEKDENRWIENSGGSALGSSQDKRRERHDDAVVSLRNDSKFQQNCYSCGALGHKMRDCPKKHSSRRKFTGFDRGPNDATNKSGGVYELERFRSKLRGNIQSRRVTKSRHGDNGASNNSRELRMATKNRNSPEIVSAQANKHEGKKRRKRETESPKRYSGRKSRRSASTSFHSDYTPSRSRSASKSSKPRASRSRFVSRAHSLSLTSRSSSKSRYSKPVNPKSRSRSSSPTSLSLSVSLGRPTSSPSKAQLNRKQSLDDRITPESKDTKLQKSQSKDSNAYSENPRFDTEITEANNGNAISASKLDDDMGQRDVDTMPALLPEVKLLKDMSALTSGPSFLQVPRETLDRTNSKPDLETSLNTCADRSTSISLEEMRNALKHYGLELPELESEKHISLEDYFGSARLWPWEGIYYRRVKKGPISVENYARRVAQNQEFGIVDKYIRSSSGWGERYKENP